MSIRTAMGLDGYLLFAIFFGVAVRGMSVPKVPAIYVFGDSLLDVGNNNYLSGNVPKADYPPYGIDFPHRKPTGRFSNGYNIMDFLAINMGFRRSPPPYLSLPTKTNNKALEVLVGINFASGGSGLLDSTGVTISTSKQIQYFSKFHSNLTTRMRTDVMKNFLSKSIFVISAGGNDIFALYTKNSSTSNIGTLISKYSEHLKDLYNFGARKFLLIDMGLIGCSPYSRALSPSEACNKGLNDLAVDFNKALKVLMINLSSTLHGMKYSIANANVFFSSIAANPNYHGTIEVKSACCGSGRLNAQVRCNQNTTYCIDRGHYLFWDMLHPTQATAKKFGLAVFSGHSQFASPISPMQLINA